MRWVLLILLLPTAIFGQNITSVDADSFVNGQTVTLVGSGFGSKSPAAPLAWETFDAYGPQDKWVEDDYASHGFYQSVNTDSTDSQYYDTNTMSGSGFACKVDMPSASGDVSLWYIFDSGDGAGYGEYVYFNISQWHNLPDMTLVFDCDEARIPQWKYHRPFHSNTAGGNNEPEYRTTWNIKESLDVEQYYSSVSRSDDNNSGWNGGFTRRPPDIPPRSTWHQQIYGLTMSSDANEYDGEVMDWIYGHQYDRTGISWCEYSGATEACGVIIRGIRMNLETIGLTSCDPDSTFEWAMDNFYADTVKSRVIMANSDTWANATKRHPQPPTYWASDGDSIQFTMNQGDAVADEEWWFFAVNASGSVSGGQSFTVAGEAGTSAPGQPTESLNGSVATYSWSAASPAPDHYQVEVIEGTSLVRGGIKTTTGTSIKITVDTSVQRRIKVYAIDADGNASSESPERVEAGI